VMVVYNMTDTGSQPESKRVIMKVSDAQKLVNEADATVLANMVIQTPDTVAVPIMISRLQAAGGLIGVGSMVDVYLNINQTGNNTTSTPQETTPRISGATVLAILRAKDSGSVDASILRSQNISVNTMGSGMSVEKRTTTDVEQLLRAAAAGGLSEEDIRAILQNYGIRLSDYERAANLGELDATYLIILEVPRDDVPFLIQNMNNIVLTVPTQNGPEWMIRELHRIYG
ncbi:MAG TPA: RcpC/CpaB family pilus assembly protein, partial [Methanothermobacter sp.]|nr:RcpC/CpaB family pilus assembly protein [Methanothermobacter sp.]HPU36694.1 RcpC/CpaB family pilus assembly protein [Methanothermobacter sp.]